MKEASDAVELSHYQGDLSVTHQVLCKRYVVLAPIEHCTFGRIDALTAPWDRLMASRLAAVPYSAQTERCLLPPGRRRAGAEPASVRLG